MYLIYLQRNIWNRPSSASPSFRSHSGDSFRKKRKGDDLDKSVLYKVAVTTGDKKGCGTDSKVIPQKLEFIYRHRNC
jgi:hypothetical protein